MPFRDRYFCQERDVSCAERAVVNLFDVRIRDGSLNDLIIIERPVDRARCSLLVVNDPCSIVRRHSSNFHSEKLAARLDSRGDGERAESWWERGANSGRAAAARAF